MQSVKTLRSLLAAVILSFILVFPAFAKPVQIPVGYNGSLLVNVLVGKDVGQATFVIDTGATSTAISKAAIEALLKAKQATFIEDVEVTLADDSKVTTKRYKISQLTIGDVVIKDIEVLVHDSSETFLLGMNVLSRLEPFSFDLLESGNAILTVDDSKVVSVDDGK